MDSDPGPYRPLLPRVAGAIDAGHGRTGERLAKWTSSATRLDVAQWPWGATM